MEFLFVVYRYNKITMYKDDPKFRRFANLEGHLEKLSTNFLLGYQPRFWKVLDNGTKVGYSDGPDQPIKAENIFLIKDCFASQSSGNDIFELQTKDKTFILKAPNEQQRTDWIKGLTFLKKVLNNQIKLKPFVTHTETTAATKSQRLKTKKVVKVQSTVSMKVERPRLYQPEDLIADANIQSELIQELKKFMPQKCLKYYTLLTNLKIKSQGLFSDNFTSNTYLLISPKTLYPDIYIGDQNLTNISLPPWLEINYFYKITDLNAKQKSKQVFHVSKIIDINQGSQKCSLKINTGEIIYQYFTETVEQKQCLKNCLLIASNNSQQVIVNGKIHKRNFDKLVNLHEKSLEEFDNEAKKIVTSLAKDPNQHKYQPPGLFQFMEGSMLFLKQFIMVLEKKKVNQDHVILDMLKVFHEQVKMLIKLTWDSSFFQIKGVQILNMLKKLSQYYQMIKNYIKSAQFLEGMKQLSKVYVRMSWTNFQSIILNIVQQQKKNTAFQDDQLQYVQTNGITDLFKFIYNVFDLAYPHWKNKIHLHNVNRLMQRALQVFVNEIRSMIDEQVISEKQMIGLANNYFCFSDYIKQFYTNKFQQLAQRTQQSYDSIINSYRDVSMIILQKLAINIGVQVQQYCHKCTIQTIKCDVLEQILRELITPIQKMIHMAFQKKFQDKIIKQIHQKICQLVSEQVGVKKKLKLKEIIRCVKQLRTGLNSIFDSLGKNHNGIDKKMQELERILSYDLYSDIESIIIACSQPTKGLYLKVMQLRQDFFEGSALYRIVNEQSAQTVQNPEIKRTTTRRRVSIDAANREKSTTLSKMYFQQEIMDSDQNTSERGASQNKNVKHNQNQVSKLISQGFLMKGKLHHKVWEKQYFRLKNGFLYIFQSQQSDRCRNAIQIKNITKVEVHNKQKPSFLLTYNNLGKQKQIKLKADSIQNRERWVTSIQLEKKRVLNQEQVTKKAIKYRQTQNLNARKKNQMIIDYQELEKGKGYFSYS